MSTQNHHHVELKIEDGELHRGFTCTAPEDAPCRRRPKDHGQRESWSRDEATEIGFPCWAVDEVNALGIEDAIIGYPDQVLARVPVTISYEECVSIEPITPELSSVELAEVTRFGIHEEDQEDEQ